MTPEQVAHIDVLADFVNRTTYWREGGTDRHEALIAVKALRAPQQAEPTCYKHDEPRKGCAWCDKQSPSATTGEKK